MIVDCKGTKMKEFHLEIGKLFLGNLWGLTGAGSGSG